MATEQELNERLVRWAGLEHKVNEMGIDEWWHGAVCFRIFPPNFTESLDACFKWLVPLAVSKIRKIFRFTDDRQPYRTLFDWWLACGIDAKALCRAIDKLIEEG